jgi:phosphonate transport system substrate-binding protein
MWRKQGRWLAGLLGLLLAALGLNGCEQSPGTSGGPRYGMAPVGETVPVYRFAVHPLFNPEKLTAAYQPLLDRLNRRLPGIRLELEASRDYAAYEAKVRAREPEVLLPNPWQTLIAIDAGYQVIGMAGDAEDFKGVFVVRKDSHVRTPADLVGQAVSYPAPTALAAAMMPQYYLQQHGLNVMRDIDNRYVGSQESSIMNVYLRQVAAGATWPPPWRAFQKDHPKEAAELKVIWETSPLLNNSVMVRGDLPADFREALRQALLALDQDEEGRAILAGMQTRRFNPADDRSYAPVRDFIRRFETEVRAVEQR